MTTIAPGRAIRGTGSGPRLRTAALVVVGVLALSGAGWSFLAAARSGPDEAEVDARAWELAGLRLELSWLHGDLLIDGLEAELRGQARPPGFEPLIDRSTDLIDRVRDLASVDDETGRRAARLLDEVEPLAIEDWPVDADRLLQLQYLWHPLADVNGPFDLASTDGDDTDSITIEQVAQAAEQATVPELVLIDAIAVALVDRPGPIASWAEFFVEDVADIVDEAPGWVGPARERPLDDSVAGGGPFAEGLPGVAEAAARRLPALQVTWDYDQWLIAGAPPGAAPATIDVLSAATDRAAGDLRIAIRAEVETQRAAAVASATGPPTTLIWLATGALCSVLALVTVGLGLRASAHQRRHLADAIYTDPLTGLGNRRHLDDRVAGECRRSGRTHLVAVLDMDRFKMVNDTWGHDAGDTLLRILASRLDGQIEDLCRLLPQATGSVVRLGGDEFVVALHATGPIDQTLVEARLRGLAGPVDIGVAEPVDLAFSLGMAVADRPADLADLIKSADLATYEDKRRRREWQRGQPTLDVSSPPR